MRLSYTSWSADFLKLTRCKYSPPPGSIETKEHLKPVAHKDQESSADHWAKRRKLFKESKQWSSAGGSSITSDITEESGGVLSHFIPAGVFDTSSTFPLWLLSELY